MPNARSTNFAAETAVGYGSQPARWHRRRRVWVLALLLAAAGVWAAWRWGDAARRQFGYMTRQRAVMSMALPADRVVYDDEPARAAALLANPGEYERTEQRFNRNGPAAHYWSAQWLAFRPGRFYDGFAFAGGRRTAGGRDRIVFVTTHVIWGYGNGRSSALYASPYVPARWRLASRIVYPKHVSTLSFGLADGQALRMYAGQRDPADEGRVTFAYDVDGTPGSIEARLVDVGPDAPEEVRASGDDTTIQWRVLSGPGLTLVEPG